MQTNPQGQNTELTQEAFSEQAQIRREKLQVLKDSGNDPFLITKYDRNAFSKDILEHYEAYADKTVRIAGRVMSRRIMGKASFVHLLDGKGQMQVYIRRDDIGTEAYQEFKNGDIGDIIGVEGLVFTTKTGEISIHAKEIKLLSKSLLPLPEKFHGLKDADTRYRQRYLDLIINPEVKDTFTKRSNILREIRSFLDEHGYLEVDTPILLPIEIGASARPFITHHNTLNMDMYMRIETELALKRLIVGGFDAVYEVGRIFRNEGMDTTHNPEFTSVELYQAYTDYYGMMELIEDLFSRVAQRVCGSMKITYQGREIDLTPPWTRLTMAEAVKKFIGVDYDTWQSDEEARQCAKTLEVEVAKDATRGAVLAEIFDEKVEDFLVQPTFILDYPVEVSPLAKRKPSDPNFTERFEFFISNHEYGNAFSELNDPIDQKERFEKQIAERKAVAPNAQVDTDYVTALEYGLPPTGGLGFGVDRMVMLLTDSASIRDVLLFPQMKPLASEKAANAETKSAPVLAEEADVPTPSAEEKIDFSKVEIEPLFSDFVDFDTFSKSDFRAVKVLACEAVKKSKKLLQFTLDDGTGTNRTILSGIHAFYEPEELVGKTLIAITNLPPRPMMGIESCGMLLSAIHKEEGEEKLHLLMVDNHIPAGAKLY